jgi:hypothetical protein
MERLKSWKLYGIISIIIVGSLMHSVYPWSGEIRWLGFLFPVNESVWEHLKMGYYAIVFFIVLEYPAIGRIAHNYWIARFCSVVLLNMVIVVVFYSYTTFLGRSIVWVDILSYVLGVILSQMAAHRIFLQRPLQRSVNYLGIAGIILIGLVFAWFTRYPPRTDIFRDCRNHRYGIDKMMEE